MTQQPQSLEEQIRILQVIVGAMVAGLVLFAGVVAFLLTYGGYEFDGAIVPLPAVGGVVAILLIVAPAAGRTAGRAPRDGDRPAVVRQFAAGTVTAMALREGAGLLGGVFGMLSGSLPWLFALVGVPVLTMLLAWPRRDELERRLRRAPE